MAEFDSFYTTGQPKPKNPFDGLFQQPPITPQDIEAPPSQGGGIIDKVLGMLGGQENVGDLASVVGSFGQGRKADRVVEGNYTQNYDRMMLDKEQSHNDQMLQAARDRNDNETDALKKLQVTSYLKGGGASQQPFSFMLGGKERTAPKFGFEPRAASDEEKAGASTLQNTIMSRFEEDGSYVPSNNYQPHDLDSYAKPGMAERISSYGAAGLGGLGALGGMVGKAGEAVSAGKGIANMLGFGGKAGQAGTGLTGAGGLMSNIMGKAVPIAGAVTGGIGLMKDRGIMGNMMNGATTGASIGSIVPGLGTLIGGGIGAGVGALRGAFGVSEAEKAGRDVASAGRSQIIAGATPQQQKEAMSAGWGNPNDALTLIVVRDALAKAGKPPEAAEQYVDALFKAEKQGPQAVQSVIQTIMAATGGVNKAPGATNAMGAPGTYRG
jgi:hypothetical protein